MPPIELDQQLIADFVDTEVTPLQALWARVHAQAAELDPTAAAYDNEIRKLNPRHQNGFMAASQKVCWVTSLKHPARGIRAGRVFPVPPLLAAQLIVGGTHQLSKPEEIESWHKEQAHRKEEAKKLELSRNPPAAAPIHNFTFSADAIEAMRATGASNTHSSGPGKSPVSAKSGQTD
jgi:hypothetical protein